MDIDRYKRQVCIILLNGQGVNRIMVAKDYAWAYRQYLDRPYASEYIEAEQKARTDRGLHCDGIKPPLVKPNVKKENL